MSDYQTKAILELTLRQVGEFCARCILTIGILLCAAAIATWFVADWLGS
jgi:hypothetical protein